MGNEYNVTWTQYNGTDYDKLYPRTKAENVSVSGSIQLSDTAVYGDPLRYNMAQQGLYFYKNDILPSRQRNSANMLLKDKSHDYDNESQLQDVNGIPTLISKIADSINVATNQLVVQTSHQYTLCTFTPNGGGRLNSMHFNAALSNYGGSSISGTGKLYIKQGGDVLWESVEFNISGSSINITFVPNISVVPTYEYTVVIAIGDSGTQGYTISAGTFTGSFAGTVYSSGYFTTKKFSMDTGYKYQMWLYHNGVSPTVSYSVNSGSFVAMIKKSQTNSKFLDGTGCWESAYELDGTIVENSVLQFKFDITDSGTVIQEMCGILL